jgi:hypothetical protein
MMMEKVPKALSSVLNQRKADTPLELAARRGHCEVLRVLLRKKEVEYHHASAALQQAIAHDQLEAMMVIIEHVGARRSDIFRPPMPNRPSVTLAATHGSIRCLDAILAVQGNDEAFHPWESSIEQDPVTRKLLTVEFVNPLAHAKDYDTAMRLLRAAANAEPGGARRLAREESSDGQNPMQAAVRLYRTGAARAIVDVCGVEAWQWCHEEDPTDPLVLLAQQRASDFAYIPDYAKRTPFDLISNEYGSKGLFQAAVVESTHP